MIDEIIDYRRRRAREILLFINELEGLIEKIKMERV